MQKRKPKKGQDAKLKTPTPDTNQNRIKRHPKKNVQKTDKKKPNTPIKKKFPKKKKKKKNKKIKKKKKITIIRVNINMTS